MADSTVSNFAPEFGPLVNPLVQGALGAYGRPAVDQAATADRPFIAGAIPGLTPQQKGALNWTNTLTTRPIDTTAQRNMVYQGTRPTTRVATGAFDTRAGLRAANPYDELVRKRAMTDFDEQASQASARRAAQQIGTRGLGTKTGLGNAQFGRDMERQRGDLNSQLLQRGFETGRGQHNADQSRALQAAMANQNASGRDRALSLQGSNQLQALENFERSAMAQNAGALQNVGSMVAGREQAVADYPWNQVNRLRSVLSGTGQQSNAAGSPWWQTAAGLAGTGASILNSTGAFGSGGWLGNLFRSGAGNGLAAGGGSLLDGIAGAAGFADGGYVDDEDEPRGAFDSSYDEDEEDEPVPDQPDVVDAEFSMVEPDGGGEDGVVYEKGGGGDEPQLEGAKSMPALGALAPPAAPAQAPQGALQAPGLAGKLPTSGYTQAQLQAALAAAAPRAQSNPGSTSADAIASLLLGIGGAPTRDFGRALAAGGQNMQATLAARKRQDQINEAARQRAAMAEAKLISDQIGKDRDIQGKGMIADAGNTAAMDREIKKLEGMERRGELDRAGRLELGKLQAASRERATLGSAGIAAAASRYATDRRAEADKSSPIGKLLRERDALPEGDPRRVAYDNAIEAAGKGPYEAMEETAAVDDYYKKVLPAAAEAVSGRDNVQQALELNKAGNSGPFAPLKQKIGNVMSDLGFKDSKAALAANNITELNGVFARAVLSEQRQQAGVQTEGDAKRLGEAVGSITLPEKANKFLLKAADAQHSRMIEQAQFIDKQKRDGNRFGGARASWMRYVASTPIFGVNPNSGQFVFHNEFVRQVKSENPEATMDQINDLWRTKYGNR